MASPSLPGGHFRVGTLASACVGRADTVVVAWPDYRDGVSRVYYRHSADGGTTWTGPGSGQPLLTGGVVSEPTLHDFMPQLASMPNGDIGCAFYEFGPTPTENLINVVMAVSTDDDATSFPNRVTVTDTAWNPAVDAPLSHGRPTTTFIGDYFGLAASALGFFPFWTDTRTGIQEIFTARVSINPNIEVTGASGVAPHGSTVLFAEGRNFLPAGRASVQINAGIGGPLVVQGWATVDPVGNFSWATRNVDCNADLAVRAKDESAAIYSNVTVTNISCPS